MSEAGTLTTAASRLSHKLVALYEGDATAAEEAVSQLTREPDALCSWATRMIRREAGQEHALAFSWDEVPQSMRLAAVRGMAIAHLIETAQT